MGLAAGASMLDSCTPDRKSEKIIPYLVPPDDGTIPGIASYVNTSNATGAAYGSGMAAKIVDYRVGKLEGIEGHPLNDGALCMQGQTSLSTLYHPERLTGPMRLEGDGRFVETTWDAAYDRIKDALAASADRKNVYLASRTTGALSALVDEFCKETGVERLPEFEVHGYAAIREANRIVFGRAEVPSYRFAKSDFLLTIGADLFETFVSPVYNGRQFQAAKRSGHFAWYHAEPHASLTGFNAKERLRVAPGSEVYLLAYLLRRVSRENVAGDRHIAGLAEALPNLPDRGYAEKTGLSVEALDHLAGQLLAARHPLVIAGGVSTSQVNGLDVAVLTALLQWASGMVGETVDFARSHDFDHVGSVADLQSLAQRLQRDQVGVVFFNDVDPLGGPIGDLLGESVNNATLRVGFGRFMTDTMKACDLILPLSDPLESWGDNAPVRGLVNVVQPVIEPLYDTKTAGDMLLELSARMRDVEGGPNFQAYLFGKWGSFLSQRQVEQLLERGYIDTGRAKEASVTLEREAVGSAIRSMKFADVRGDVLYVTPSVRAYDERMQNLPLLQEIPDPITTVTWGAWVSVAKDRAREMGLDDAQRVRIEAAEWSAELPVRIQPGMPRDVVTIQYNGWGSTPVAISAGSGEMGSRFDGVKLTRIPGVAALPIMSGSQSEAGRRMLPDAHGEEHGEHHDTESTLYPPNPYPDYRWGMAIDLDLCTGCSACIAACYVENNVPISGHDDHMNGREMSWLRMEPFYDDHTEVPTIRPMLCQHCSNAPCESVCPVFATYHSPEGLNAQIYNRCVGTRYCANNCPYKVRRFNWFDYKRITPLNTTRNPEVSVRGRGVMEKCSFCVQRIRKARDHAKDEGRKILDGEVTPACAQTCPTEAISFGNLLDEESTVSKMAHSDRNYRVLDTLGTQPAVHYLRNKWEEDHA